MVMVNFYLFIYFWVIVMVIGSNYIRRLNVLHIKPFVFFKKKIRTATPPDRGHNSAHFLIRRNFKPQTLSEFFQKVEKK